MEKQIVERIQNAIDFIENNLYEKIVIEHVAKIAYMSQSSFYNVFASVFGTTVKDYIRKRRLSLSAYDLIHSDSSILDIALKYQYCAYESYSRAFKNLFGISPKKYRQRNLYTNVFPRVYLNLINLSGGENMLNKEMNKGLVIKKLHSISKGYILDIDIDRFEQINKKFGYKVGDKVLIEVPERVKRILSRHNLNVDVTRINADEFVVIIKDKSKSFVEDLSKEIINEIGSTYSFDGQAVKVTVSIGISDFSVDNNHETIMNNAKEAMLIAKKNGRNQYKLFK